MKQSREAIDFGKGETMSRSVGVGVNYWPSRYLPPQAGAEIAAQLEASGVVDWFQTWDQLVSFLPQALWRPDVTPMAGLSVPIATRTTTPAW